MSDPTIGRIVHYVSYGTPNGEYTSKVRAAVVTAVGDDTENGVISLAVLNPTGFFFDTACTTPRSTRRVIGPGLRVQGSAANAEVHAVPGRAHRDPFRRRQPRRLRHCRYRTDWSWSGRPPDHRPIGRSLIPLSTSVHALVETVRNTSAAWDQVSAAFRELEQRHHRRRVPRDHLGPPDLPDHRHLRPGYGQEGVGDPVNTVPSLFTDFAGNDHYVRARHHRRRAEAAHP